MNIKQLHHLVEIANRSSDPGLRSSLTALITAYSDTTSELRDVTMDLQLSRMENDSLRGEVERLSASHELITR